jgi:acyl-CoA reductase-like NAD-dependent aldehyde dehydrogenase
MINRHKQQSNMADTTNGTHKPVSFATFHNIIAGQPCSSIEIHQGINPSTGKELWDVPIATQHDLDDAVKSSQGAFKVWSKMPWEERQKVLLRIAEEAGKYDEEMARLVMLEGGKPVSSPNYQLETKQRLILGNVDAIG